MKKRWFCIVLAAMVAIGIVLWRAIPDQPPTVTTTVLTPTRVEQTVSCNGVIEAADGVGVFVPVACQIADVRVTVGQRVAKGDVLAVIDKEATSAATTDIPTQVALAALETELVAPEDGIVAQVSAESGKTLKAGTPCAWIVRPCDLQIRVAIREKDLRTIGEGMAVRISGDGLNQTAYMGKLTEVSCAASADGSVPMVAGIVTLDEDQVDASFRLGLSAKVTVITSVTEEGYVIPYEAVLADEEGSYVYLLKDGVARKQYVVQAVSVPSGLLLTGEEWNGQRVVLDSEQVRADGAVVLEVTS